MKLSKLRVEYIICGLLFLLVLLLLVYAISLPKHFDFRLIFNPYYLIEDFFGNVYFEIPFALIFLYIFSKVQIDFILIIWKAIPPYEYYRQARGVIFDVLFTFCFTGISLVFLSLAIKLLFATAEPHKTAMVSSWLMSIDKAVFGVYPIFALHALSSIPRLEWLLIFSYRYLFTILGALFLLLFISKKKRAFRRFVVSFFLCAILALPMWFFAPAVSPQLMYNKNIFSLDMPKDVEVGLSSLNQSSYFKAFLNATDRYWLALGTTAIAVSSNPSMHVAWGIIILYFAFVLWRPLGIILVPWSTFNTIATVYTLQHYAVDVFFGVILGVLALVFTRQLFVWEERWCKSGDSSTHARNRPFVYETLANNIKSFKMFISLGAR